MVRNHSYRGLFCVVGRLIYSPSWGRLSVVRADSALIEKVNLSATNL